MLKPLKPLDTDKAIELFRSFWCLAAIKSILAGLSPGQVYVDDRQTPKTAVTWFKRRLFLAGQPENVSDVRQLLTDIYFSQARADGLSQSVFTLHYTPVWEDSLPVLLAHIPRTPGRRLCYRLNPVGHHWTPTTPLGFDLRPVDVTLLADTRLTNLDYVTVEMVSERPSVDDFLAKSFGTCVVHGNEIVGWCMSEYNVGQRCELGIETAAPYRRRGLARAIASATIQQAVEHGLTEIGWVCEADNLPSVATAEALGFERMAEFPVVYGNFCTK